MGCRFGALSGPGGGVLAVCSAGTLGGDGCAAWQRSGGADRRRVGARTRHEGRARRAAAWLQVLRKDAPAGVVQAGAQPESRSDRAVRQQRAVGDSSSAVSPRRGRHGGSGDGAQRCAGGHLRTEEPADRPALASRSAAVPRGSQRTAARSAPPAGAGVTQCGSTERIATPRHRCSGSANGHWCISLPTPTRCT